MNFTEEQAQQLRGYAKGLPEEERKSFITKFQSLSDDKQATVMSRLFGETTGKTPSGAGGGFGDGFLPNAGAVEQNISQRPSQFQGLVDMAKNIQQHPIKTLSDPMLNARMGLNTLGAVAGTVEAPIASVGLDVQRGNINPQMAINAVNAVRGKNPAQLGDIVRTTGFGGGLNEPLAASAGLLGMAKIGNIPIDRIAGNIGNKIGNTNLAKAMSSNKSSAFAGEIRNAFVNAHTQEVDKFGRAIDALAKQRPDASVSLRGVVDEINGSDLPNEVKNVFKKTPILRDMLKTPDLADKVPLKSAQDIINYINTKVPKNIRANNLDLIDTLNSIKAAQLDAFPEMAKVKADYAGFIQPYNNIKNMFKVGKLLESVKSNFKDPELRMAVDKVLPKSVIKQMGGYRRAANVIKMAWKAIPLAGLAAAGGAGYGIGRIVTGARE